MRHAVLLSLAVLVTALSVGCENSQSVPNPFAKPELEICNSGALPTDNFPSTPPEFQVCNEILTNNYRIENQDKPTSKKLESVRVTDILEKKDTEQTIYHKLTTPNAEWYFDNQNISMDTVVKTASTYETLIYPSLSLSFGTPWLSSIKSEDKLKIIHVPLGTGIAGYFKNTDLYPKEVYPTSNEISAIYLHSDLQIGSKQYLAVLTHELQHAMHWNKDRTEETWVNEGLSEYSLNSTDYRPFKINSFNPEISLINWSYSNQLPHYLSARLFFTYLIEQYLPNPAQLLDFVSIQQDGIEGIETYLESIGLNKSFMDIFGEWAIYNLLNGSDPDHSYNNIEGNTYDYANQNSIGFGEIIQREIKQYSTHYIDVAVPKEDGKLSINFEGSLETFTWFSPIETSSQMCHWSDRGDFINSTMLATLDLSETVTPSLEFRSAFNIEEGWDFVHLLISEDNGDTWSSLNSSDMQPAPYSMAHLKRGYTGSKPWSDYSINLSKYQSKKVILKLSYITDASTTGPGFCIADTFLKDDQQQTPIIWQHDGFIPLSNTVNQKYIVNVILMGKQHKIIPINLDDNNKGAISIPVPEYGSWYVVSVSAVNKESSLPAPYTVTVNRLQHR